MTSMSGRESENRIIYIGDWQSATEIVSSDLGLG